MSQGTRIIRLIEGVKAPGDLIEHQAVIYEQRAGGPTWTFRQGTTETTVTVRGRLRVSAAEGVREGVLAGLGLSIGGSECLFTPELKSGAVISVLQDWSLPAMDLWALFPAGRQARDRKSTRLNSSHLVISYA